MAQCQKRTLIRWCGGVAHFSRRILIGLCRLPWELSDRDGALNRERSRPRVRNPSRHRLDIGTLFSLGYLPSTLQSPLSCHKAYRDFICPRSDQPLLCVALYPGKKFCVPPDGTRRLWVSIDEARAVKTRAGWLQPTIVSARAYHAPHVVKSVLRGRFYQRFSSACVRQY